MAIRANATGGRPSKGSRRFIGFRVQDSTADEVAFMAASRGLTVTDYVADALARQLARDQENGPKSGIRASCLSVLRRRTSHFYPTSHRPHDIRLAPLINRRNPNGR